MLLIAAVCGFIVPAAAQSIPTQVTPYNVNYHWGLINVMIARGNVTVQSDGNQFYGTLDGTSIPWEGKIICVSDTLQATMNTEPGQWKEYVQYQNGWYRHPSVSSFRSSTYNPEDPAIYKNIEGQGSYDASHDSMEAITVTSDMLGLYYFVHFINFEAMQPGQSIVIPIEGPYSKEVTITYNGQDTYVANGSTYPTYDCTFEYSYEGGGVDYPVECKVSATDRIIVYLSASLPVGRVEMLYDPAY